MDKNTDDVLRRKAQARVGFKTHLLVYVLVNALLWAIYLMGDSGDTSAWPAWTTFWWGLGLAFHGVAAYANTGFLSVDREYEKLKGKK